MSLKEIKPLIFHTHKELEFIYLKMICRYFKKFHKTMLDTFKSRIKRLPRLNRSQKMG